MSVATTPYNAPSYFSTYYFPDLVATDGAEPPTFPTPTPSPAVPATIEVQALRAIVDRLRGLGLFEEVRLDEPSRNARSLAARYPYLIILPTRWEDIDENDSDTLRRFAFTIALIVSADTPESRIESALSLASAIRDALESSDLNGLVLPAMTRLRAAKFTGASPLPETRLEIEGEFAILLDHAPIVAARS